MPLDSDQSLAGDADDPASHMNNSSSSPRPQSAIDRLDDSVRLLMQTADLNGGGDDDDEEKLYRSSERRHHVSSSSFSVTTKSLQEQNGLLLKRSEQQQRLSQSQKMVITKSDVVRIHVPYGGLPESVSTEAAAFSSVTSTSSKPNKRLSAPPR